MTKDNDTKNPYSPSLAADAANDRFTAAWKLSSFACALTIIATVYNIFKLTDNMWPSSLADALVFSVVTFLMVFPYIAFGALILTLRSNRPLSLILLAIIVLVSFASTVAFSIETNAYLNRDKSVPGGQRLGTFLIGLAQWASVIFVSSVLLPVFFYMKDLPDRNKPACTK